MKFYRWLQFDGTDQGGGLTSVWYVDTHLSDDVKWELFSGRHIDNWESIVIATCEEEAEHSDFPFTNNDVPVYSPHLKRLMETNKVRGIQYLPIQIRGLQTGEEISGYNIANYLQVIDCLDRERSDYQIWTKENLLFWEKRPYMLGTFRDVMKVFVDLNKVGNAKVFRLWGWEVMVIVREDVKQFIEGACITGCVFTELQTS